MKKIICAFLAALLLITVSLPLLAGAEGLVDLYMHDGRMVTVPVSEADAYRAQGWQDDFPYCGKTVWLRNTYLFYHTTDVYGTDTYTLVNWDNLPCFIPVTILWYAYEDMEYIDGVQKRLNTLIFDYNGGQFKMSMRDFLRSGPDYIDYPWIYWDDPKTSNGISDESWNMIQQELFWIGMPKNEFLLMKGLDPKSINSYNYGYGTTEQWVYSSGYYYFRDGVLTSWQVF